MSKPKNPLKVRAWIITVSDTRTLKTDKSGLLIEEALIEAGHEVIGREMVVDNETKIHDAVEKRMYDEQVDVILTNGGTGISYRDVTIEAVEPLLDKEIPGFGEIFRTLSYYEDIGASAIMSRAIAGVANHTAVFVMPGSSGAVKLAMNKLIIPEISHVFHEITKEI